MSPDLKGCVWVMSCERLEFVWCQKGGHCLKHRSLCPTKTSPEPGNLSVPGRLAVELSNI